MILVEIISVINFSEKKEEKEMKGRESYTFI
jgi:hypothetical protein